MLHVAYDSTKTKLLAPVEPDRKPIAKLSRVMMVLNLTTIKMTT